MKQLDLRALPCLPLLLAFSTAGAQPHDPVADPAAVVTSGNARFTVLTDGLVRLEWSPDGSFEDRASQAIVNRRLPVPKFEKTDNSGLVIIRTPKIQLQYRSSAGVFGRSSLQMRARVGSGDSWVDIVPPVVQTSNLGGTTRTLDGVSGSCPIEDGLLTRSGWTLLDDSRSLVLEPAGDGSQERAETVSKTDRDCDVSSWSWAAERKSKQAVDWYLFVYGNNYPQTLADFIKIGGRIPLPPRYVFGTWWSRYWAYSDKELKQLVAEFREHDVPLDVLVIDMDWHLDGWTGYTWNPDYFPDPDGFLKWAHEQGLKVTLNLHPADGVGKHEAAFKAMCEALGLDPEKTERIPFNCTDRRFIEAYFRLLHHPLEQQGIDFWWMDWQQGSETKIAGLDPLWWLNHLHWKDMECRQDVTGRRPLIFSRWGGLGNHRYQIGFSGDTFCNWPSLAFQPYFTATAGNVGYAYWSHDIGGHQPGPVDPEMYARWIAWGAMSPILRTHTTKNPAAERRIWKFPKEVFEAARSAFHFRHELIPYIYTMARRSYDTGLPLCRPLYYHWPEQDAAYTWHNQYMFGDDMLVAPVVEPNDAISGTAMFEVWLPPGKWVNWNTGRHHEGPVVVPQVVPLDQIPIFVRAGAIIPTGRTKGPIGGEPVDPLVLNVFPADAGETRVYEDDGLSSGYLKDICAWTPVRQKWEDGKRVITIDPPVGIYPGMATKRGYIVRLFDFSPRVYEVAVDGQMLNVTFGEMESDRPYWFYDASNMGPAIHIPRRSVSEPVQITITEPREYRGDERALDGFRGMMAALCAVNRDNGGMTLGGSFDCGALDFVFRLFEGPPLDVVGMWKDAWPMNLDGLRKLELEPDRERRLLLRLLGLYYKLDIRPDKSEPRALSARVSLGSILPLDLTRDMTGKVTLKPEEGWKLEGYSEKEFAGLMDGELLSVEARLLAPDQLDTTIVRANIELEHRGIPLSVPLEAVVLPSVNAWWVVGPFDVPFAEALDRKLPPEEKIDLTAKYKGKDGREIGWRQVRRELRPGEDMRSEFFMDFDDVFGGRVYESAAYAMTYLDSTDAMDATLAVGSDDGVAVWLNGEKIHRHQVGRPYSSRQDRVPARLRKGRNELLVKVSQGGGDWGLCVHVETSDGKPLTQVKARLE